MKRPLFWIGLTFISSTAVFLRFPLLTALSVCAVISLCAAFLAAPKFDLKRAAVLFVAALFSGGWLYLYNFAQDIRLAPVKDTSGEYAVIQATVTDCRPVTGYQTLSAYGGISVAAEKRTAEIKLSGYYHSAPKRGDTVSCLAVYENDRYVIKHFIGHDGSVLNPLISFRISVQNAVSQKLDELFDKTPAAVLSALLVGDSSKLDYDTVSAFRKSSLSHLLVVSGMHLLIISHSVSLILGRFLSDRAGSVISLLFCWGFASLSGFGVSIVRAALMLTVMNIGTLIGKKSDTLTSLMTAAIIIVLPSPQAVLSASFLLSFSAVAGLALLQKPIFKLVCGNKQSFLTKTLLESASSAAAAQLATSPVCALLFKTVPMLGVPANIAAVWLIQPIMLLGILSLAVGSISPALAFPFVTVCKLLVYLIISIAKFFASIPFITLHFTEYWQIVWLVGAVILSVIIICRLPTAKVACTAAIALSAIYAAAALVSFGLSANHADIVVFEQSDCSAVVKGSHAVLIGSPNDRWQRLEISNALSVLGVEQLDAVILTYSSRADYSTVKLAADFNCHYLCMPNSRDAAVFCHGSGLELCQLPQGRPLFGKMTLTADSGGFELLFKNGKLLKSNDKCDIIGRYSYPMPINGTLRYRIET